MDIHDYKKRLERVENDIRMAGFSDKNKSIIFAFERELSLRELSIPRIDRHLRSLKKIGEKISKDFDTLDKDDIYDFLAWLHRRTDIVDWTKYSYKVTFRMLLRSLKRDDLADLITLKSVDEKIPDIFTREEVLRMINEARHPMDKAVIASLYETGCRIGEIAGMRIKDVRFDDYGAILIVDGKTGMRRVRSIFSAPYLSAWLDIHPFRQNPEAPLWIRFGRNGKSKNNGCDQIMYPALAMRLKRIASRAGIKKRVHFHLFRHTSATEKAEILTEAQMCEYYGWIQGSDMPRTYIHLSGRNLDDTLLKAYGLKKDDTPKDKELSPINCPRCRTLNGPTSKFCYRCGAAFDLGAVMDLDKERAALTLELMEILMNEPELYHLIKSKMSSMKKQEQSEEKYFQGAFRIG